MRPNIVSIFFLTFTLFCTSSLLNGQENSFPNPSSQITASDHPWDHGEKIDLNWILSADDQISVKIYSIYKSVDSDPDSFIFIGNVNPGVFSLTVEKLDRKESYFFKVIAVLMFFRWKKYYCSL